MTDTLCADPCSGMALDDSPSARVNGKRVGMRDKWIAVCRLTDIVPNTGVCALVAGRQVAVFRLDDDSVHAIDNHDPFSRANVLSRGIVGDVKGELVVASPVYKHHFSLASGQCLEDPAVRIAVFAVRLDGDTVWVRGAQ